MKNQGLYKDVESGIIKTKKEWINGYRFDTGANYSMALDKFKWRVLKGVYEALSK